jgi:hypothetical protein
MILVDTGVKDRDRLAGSPVKPLAQALVPPMNGNTLRQTRSMQCVFLNVENVIRLAE